MRLYKCSLYEIIWSPGAWDDRGSPDRVMLAPLEIRFRDGRMFQLQGKRPESIKEATKQARALMRYLKSGTGGKWEVVNA